MGEKTLARPIGPSSPLFGAPAKRNRFRRSILPFVLAGLALCPAVRAGHVLGIGNYSYDLNALRPQLRVSERVDDWRIDLGGYPGDPNPGEPVDFRIVVRSARDARLFAGPVECTIHRISPMGSRQLVVRSQPGTWDGTGHGFRLSLPDDAEYDVTFAFAEDPTRPSSLSVPFVVGQPGSPWKILGGFAAGTALFIAGVAIVGTVRTRRALAGEAA